LANLESDVPWSAVAMLFWLKNLSRDWTKSVLKASANIYSMARGSRDRVRTLCICERVLVISAMYALGGTILLCSMLASHLMFLPVSVNA